MKTYLECLPCVVRQALEGARHVSNDQAVQQEILRRAGEAVAQVDMNESPPVLISEINRIIRDVTGSDDPYKQAKATCNQAALELYPELKNLIRESTNPFETAVRIAIAGNIIDFVVDPHADQSNVKHTVEEALAASLSTQTLNEFENAVLHATDILYIGDNAGEIVFDRLLIEQLPTDKVTYVVKGRPVINDVTMEDARAVGMTDLVEVIESGSDLPGTVIPRCTKEFQKRFYKADLIISKGQGSYESLDDIDKRIFFLFRAKCIVIKKALGVEVGTIMLVNRACRTG